jgi:O-antigen ligase/cytochrome c-type biogenesis protein CcmH/NrfG
MLGLGTMAEFTITYFAIVLLARSRRDGIAVALSALAGSAVVLAYEAVQLAGKDPFDWNVNTAVRPFSTLGQTTTLAEYLTVLSVGAAALAVFAERLRAPLRIGLLLYSGLLLAGMLATQTRSALLGVAAGAAVLVLLTWVAHPDRRARVLSLIGATASTAVVLVILFFTPLGARVLATVELPGADLAAEEGAPRLEQSAGVRLDLYTAALQMVRDRPLLGYGPDNFAAAFPSYRTETEQFELQQSLPTSAHGWLAQIAATSGLLGIASFLAVGVLALALTVRAGFRPIAWVALSMIAALLGAGVTTVSDVGVDWAFWALAGVVAAVTATRTDVVRPPETTGRRLVAFVFVAVGFLLALTVVTAHGASRSALASRQARLAGQPAQAIGAALSATRSDSGRAQYWDGLGLAYVSAQRANDAVTAFDRAAALAPYDIRYQGDLVRAYLLLAQRGDSAAGTRAREVAERSVRADPNNPLANQTRALVMQVTGDFQEALRSAERALALDQSNNREIYLTKTQVLEALGRPSDAIASARFGLTRIPDPRNQVALRIELARALMTSGQLKDALTEVDAALAIQPNQPAALELKAQIQAGLTR